MKKIYIKPNTETVNVRLNSSVLENPGIEGDSKFTNELGAKQNDLLFEDEGDFGDIWGEGDSNSNPYDLWGED